MLEIITSKMKYYNLFHFFKGLLLYNILYFIYNYNTLSYYDVFINMNLIVFEFIWSFENIIDYYFMIKNFFVYKYYLDFNLKKFHYNKKYWDLNYSLTGYYDWTIKYKQLKERDLLNFFHKDDKILIAGCGNSTFSSELYDDGFKNIYNIDYCERLIKNEKIKNYERKYMQYDVMNVQQMSYNDNTFDIVVDKALFDTLLCCMQKNKYIISNMISEVLRVLKVNGLFYIVSFQNNKEEVKEFLLKHYNNNDYPFKVILEKTIENINRNIHIIILRKTDEYNKIKFPNYYNK